MEKLGKPVINLSIRFSMKIIKFNKNRFLKDLDFVSRNRKLNFSNKANIVKKILKDVKAKRDNAIVYYQKKFDRSAVSKKNIY